MSKPIGDDVRGRTVTFLQDLRARYLRGVTASRELATEDFRPQKQRRDSAAEADRLEACADDCAALIALVSATETPPTVADIDRATGTEEQRP